MKIILVLSIALLSITSASAQINFFDGTYEEAKVHAKKNGKMIFLDFYADWCVPCKQMEKYGFRDRQFSRVVNSYFVAVKVDVDMFAGMDVAERFKVNKYPTLIIADAKGKERTRTEGYQSVDELNALVRSYDK